MRIKNFNEVCQKGNKTNKNAELLEKKINNNKKTQKTKNSFFQKLFAQLKTKPAEHEK